MITIKLTKRFEKAATALGPQERERAQKSIKQFLQNPRHPSLNFEKLSTGFHTIRVDLNFRIAMRKESADCYEFVDVDSHVNIYNRWG